jgi:hypothetical protein
VGDFQNLHALADDATYTGLDEREGLISFGHLRLLLADRCCLGDWIGIRNALCSLTR